ncbi:MAG: hypothetical protein AAFW89_01985 [Bacteroidota bacterium]
MKRTSFTVVLLLLLSSVGAAQMFSADVERRRTNIPREKPLFRFGVSPVNFDFTGNPANVPANRRFDLERTAVNLAFESPGLTISALFSNRITGNDDDNIFQLQLALGNGFRLNRNRTVQLSIPFGLKSDFTTAGGGNLEDTFNLTSIGLFSGASVAVRLRDAVVFRNEFVPSYGFSNAAGGFFGGSFFGINGKSRLTFLSLIGDRNISIGYDFVSNSFDIEDDEFDYDLTAHVFTIGISL